MTAYGTRQSGKRAKARVNSRLLGNQRGATLLMVLVLVVILGLAAGMAGTTWKTVMQRVKEEELLFRGDQYRQAIQSYMTGTVIDLPSAPRGTGVAGGRAAGGGRAATGGGAPTLYPAKLEDLLRDPRSPQAKRHLRQLYKDPITGEDFELIKAPDGRIKGVRSSSQEAPLKQDNFTYEYEPFKGKTTYREWEFVFEPGKDQSVNSTPPATIQNGGTPTPFSNQPPPGSNSD